MFVVNIIIHPTALRFHSKNKKCQPHSGARGKIGDQNPEDPDPVQNSISTEWHTELNWYILKYK